MRVQVLPGPPSSLKKVIMSNPFRHVSESRCRPGLPWRAGPGCERPHHPSGATPNAPQRGRTSRRAVPGTRRPAAALLPSYHLPARPSESRLGCCGPRARTARAEHPRPVTGTQCQTRRTPSRGPARALPEVLQWSVAAVRAESTRARPRRRAKPE